MGRHVVLGCLMWLAASSARAQTETPAPAIAPQVAPVPAAPQQVAPVVQPVVVGEIAPHGKALTVPGARPMTLTERLLLRQQWMMYRERDRRAVNLVGPVLGLTACLGTLGLTSWMVSRDNQQVQVTGAVLTGVLVVPLISASIWVLSRRVKKRREIYREIWGAPPVVSIPLGWRF
jgi:hypothetical protein